MKGPEIPAGEFLRDFFFNRCSLKDNLGSKIPYDLYIIKIE